MVEYLGPGSREPQPRGTLSRDITGPPGCNEFRTLGYEQTTSLPIGSPRFDLYITDAQKKAERQKESSTLTILSNTPTMDIGERYGTFDFEEYFKNAWRCGAEKYRMRASSSLIALDDNARIFREDARTRQPLA